MSLLSFLDSNYTVDASGKSISTSSTDTITVPIYYNLHGLTVNPFTDTFTIQQYDPTNTTVISTGLPYTIGVAVSNASSALLTITLNKAAANVLFGLSRRITITAASGGSTDIYLTVNYAVAVNEAGWDNATDLTTLGNVELHGAFTSTSMNNILKAIYQAAMTAYNQIKKLWIFYSFKDKLLQDIIDLAINAGVAPDNSTAVITFNSDGTVNTLMTTYLNNHRLPTRNFQILVTYTYTSYAVNRLQVRTSGTTILATTSVNLVSGLTIQACDNSGNILYTLANIAINRTQTQYFNPYLADYNPSLPNPTIDPNNLLSDYKYYNASIMTGWTVAV